MTAPPPATGTIEFKVYGPFPSQPGADSCVDGQARRRPSVRRRPSTGRARTRRQNVQVKLAGYYVWDATYSGDANNESATHACGQTEETTVVDKASPSISTQVAAGRREPAERRPWWTPPRSAAAPPTRQATGDDHLPPVRPVRRRPRTATAAPRASSSPPRSSTVTNGNGSYVSPAVVVGAAGYYTWVATLLRRRRQRAGHAPVRAARPRRCWSRKAPTAVSDRGHRPGGHQARPDHYRRGLRHRPDRRCHRHGDLRPLRSGQSRDLQSARRSSPPRSRWCVTVGDDGSATGSATSAAFTPTAPGTYRWIASLHRRRQQRGAAPGACNDPNEQSLVLAGDNPEPGQDLRPAVGEHRPARVDHRLLGQGVQHRRRRDHQRGRRATSCRRTSR